MATLALDLGCGPDPKNPFNCDEVYGVDIRNDIAKNVRKADLAIEPIPFGSGMFDFVTAFDFIEHVPRVIYAPHRRFCFVEVMNEIHRVLKPGGIFFSYTPAHPAAAAWRDPTHVNIITDETFTIYFDDVVRGAKMYGFTGAFKILKQVRHDNGIHLVTHMRKVEPRPE